MLHSPTKDCLSFISAALPQRLIPHVLQRPQHSTHRRAGRTPPHSYALYPGGPTIQSGTSIGKSCKGHSKMLLQNPSSGNHHRGQRRRRNDNADPTDVGNDGAHIRLIQEAEGALRTYSRRRRTKRQQRSRIPPKTSLFDFERRRREKRSAGYEADSEDVAVADGTNIAWQSCGTKPDVGIFPVARSSHRRKKKRYESIKQIHSGSKTLSADRGQQISNHNQRFMCPLTTANGVYSSYSQQIAADGQSVGTAGTASTCTMATSISAPTTCAIPAPTCQLPFFQLDSGPTPPFTLSQNALTMSQAIGLSHYAHIIVDARTPFVVKHANAAFCRILAAGDEASASVLGEPLLTNRDEEEGQQFTEPHSRLQKLILGAGKIILFPIVSECGGGNAAAAVVGSRRIITHFLIQVVDPIPHKNAVQVVA